MTFFECEYAPHHPPRELPPQTTTTNGFASASDCLRLSAPVSDFSKRSEGMPIILSEVLTNFAKVFETRYI